MNTKKWSETMRGKFINPRSSKEGQEERAEYKRLLARISSKQRYLKLKGTPLERVYWPSRRCDKFTKPYALEELRVKERMQKRIARLFKGTAKLGIQMRCDCGQLVSTCLHDSEEILVFKELIGDLCKLHL